MSAVLSTSDVSPNIAPFRSPSLPALGPKSPFFVFPSEDLYKLRQLEVTWEERRGALWSFMRPDGRPSYNLGMLEDFHSWQDGIEQTFSERPKDLRYLVLGSRFPGVFSFGGDLNLFVDKIRKRDRGALVQYGRSCVQILHRNMLGLKLPVVTIGLVQGDALGGGFESLLSFNVIIAEKGTKFGLPETLFGLFPGMGAYSFLSRRVGAARAEQMILSGRTYTAEEMHDQGVVHVLAEPGEGIAAVQMYIDRNARRHSGHRAIYRAGLEVNPVSLDELERIVDIWADASLQLGEQELRIMERLVTAQNRLLGVPALAAE